MAAKATTQEVTQPKLVTPTPAQRRIRMGEALVERELKRIERETHLGHSKTLKNEMDTLLEEAKTIARETVTGQLKLAIEEVFEEGEDDLEGRVMGQSNVLRRHPEDWTDEDDKTED